MTLKKDPKMYSANPLYLLFVKMNGYFEISNENTSENLTLIPNNGSKEKINTQEELRINRSLTKILDDIMF